VKSTTEPVALVVMGVSGSGKSSVGRAVAAAFGYGFVDADDLHPPANVAKMRGGTPLDDDDRGPWLAAVATVLQEHLAEGKGIVVACSALKKVYRDRLRTAGQGVRFVHLHGSEELMAQRLARRGSHFFDPRLLASQFTTLEVPDPAREPDVLMVDAAASIATIIGAVTTALGSVA